MRIDLLLILFLALWDGRAGLIRAQTVYEAAEGGNVTVQCSFYFGGNKKTFCKNDCNKDKNILVQTSGNTGRNGRYSIKYERNVFSYDLMYVSITNVTSSDSGRFQCVLDRLIDGSYTFTIKVTKDGSLNPTYTLKPNGTPSSPTVKTTSSTSETTTEQSVTQAPVLSEHFTTASGAPLYVGLTLAAVLILFSAALLIMCWNKRTNKSKQPPAVIPEANRLYEQIPENNVQSTTRPVEVSTVYATASFNTTIRDGTSDVYSLVTKQRQAASTSSEVHYVEVDFFKSGGPSVNSAPRSQPDPVLYSTIQVKTEDALYSTLSLPQS